MTRPLSKYSLQALMDETNKILEDLNPDDIDGAINWADLRCVDAMEVQSVHNPDEPYYQVEIEEVAPDAYELMEAVHKALADRGFYHVQVVTAW